MSKENTTITTSCPTLMDMTIIHQPIPSHPNWECNDLNWSNSFDEETKMLCLTIVSINGPRAVQSVAMMMSMVRKTSSIIMSAKSEISLPGSR